MPHLLLEPSSISKHVEETYVHRHCHSRERANIVRFNRAEAKEREEQTSNITQTTERALSLASRLLLSPFPLIYTHTLTVRCLKISMPAERSHAHTVLRQYRIRCERARIASSHSYHTKRNIYERDISRRGECQRLRRTIRITCILNFRMFFLH